ncbi:MAG: TonB-dependent receptor [Saprospiraceae bacterium]|nr:TonB-dependent receptor [Saprospiraceae bacterium]
MRSLKIIILFLCGLSWQVGFAQNTISGSVYDAKNGDPLVGASVYISDLKLGVSTDFDGSFSMEDLKSGTYLLEISYIGYKNEIIRLNLAADTSLSIKLDPAVSELNEVVVTAVTRSTELRHSPVIIKALDKNSINQQSSTNLIDALRDVPGVDQISSGAAISKPIIRGLGYNRVITLYNGIRQEGQQWGDEHGIEIDEYSIDRIEIVKGPGSLIYGSDGIAGVLNFLSPKAPHLGEVKSQLVTNYQTNNNLVGYSLSNTGNKGGVYWLGRFSNKYAGNYQNKYDGRVYNSGFKEYDGSLYLGIQRNWGHSTLDFSTFNTTLNLVEGERDDQGAFMVPLPDGTERAATSEDLKGYHIGYPHQGIQHIRLASNNYFLLNRSSLNADFAFQQNQRKEFGDVTNPDDIALFFDLKTFNYNLRLNLPAKNGLETSFGVGGMFQNNENRGLEFLIPAYNLMDAGVFVFSQKTFNDHFTIAGGLRLDNRSMHTEQLILDSLEMPVDFPGQGTEVKFPSFKKNFGGLSGSLGLSYQINANSTLKLNISRGFRAPTAAELASNGRHEGTFRYEIGSENLKSEINHQFDIAYFLNSDHFVFEVTPFTNFISNYIYIEKLKDASGNDVIPDPEDPAPAFQFVQGNATLFGGELYVDIHPHPLDWLHFEHSFSIVTAQRSNASDSTRYLPFIPAPKYNGVIRAQLKKVGNALTNVYVKFGINHYFKQDRIFSAYGTETATPAYTLLNAGLGADLKAFENRDFITIILTGDNLGDVAYQSHLSRLKYAPENPATGRTGVFNMGRNLSLKLIFNF